MNYMNRYEKIRITNSDRMDPIVVKTLDRIKLVGKITSFMKIYFRNAFNIKYKNMIWFTDTRYAIAYPKKYKRISKANRERKFVVYNKDFDKLLKEGYKPSPSIKIIESYTEMPQNTVIYSYEEFAALFVNLLIKNIAHNEALYIEKLFPKSIVNYSINDSSCTLEEYLMCLYTNFPNNMIYSDDIFNTYLYNSYSSVRCIEVTIDKIIVFPEDATIHKHLRYSTPFSYIYSIVKDCLLDPMAIISINYKN